MITIEQQLEYSKALLGIPQKYSNTPEYMFPPTGVCPGCVYTPTYRLFLKAAGPKVVLIEVPGCGGTGLLLTDDNKPIDKLGCPFGNSASFASGISAALQAQGDNETIVAPIVGDGAALDIGMGALSAAAERNDNMIFVVKDNEGYQNTGGQRSSAGPWMSTNTTNPQGFRKVEFKKDIDTIMAAHRIPYLATATIAFPDDYMRKVRKAKSIKGFKLLHVFCPCPTGWGFPAEMTVALARLAVETKVFPLYEVENGVKYTINHEPKGLPLSEYVKKQRRFRDISSQDLDIFEKAVEEGWQRLKFLASY